MTKRLARLTARMNRTWVNAYTRGLPSRAMRERREEIYAEILESETDAQKISSRASVQTMTRMLRGVPSDLVWRREAQRRTSLRTNSRGASTGGYRMRRRPRGPGVVYGVVTTLVLIVVGTIALTSRHASPPTIAEFAPRAVEQITGSSGDSAGTRGAASGRTSELDDVKGGTGSGLQTIDVARVRQCVGDPPRQIEDPQSPPCVPYWSGDNGGVTAKGVTRDEVVVIANSWGESTTAATPLWAAFFNKRFEFYGRKLRLVMKPHGGINDPPAKQRADAVEYDNAYQPFASTSKVDGISDAYSFELARRRIIGTIEWGIINRDVAERYRPYLWTYGASPDVALGTIGNWTCARLAGRNAAYAGPSDADDMSTRTRSFGVILTKQSEDHEIGPEPLVREMERCNSRPARTFTVPFSSFTNDAATDQNMMLQMKMAGVTTVLCVCHWAPQAFGMQPAATAQAYFPEWLVQSYGANDSNGIAQYHKPDQWQRAFGLSFFPMQLSYHDNPAVDAVLEMDPSFPKPDGRSNRDGAPPSLMGNYYWRNMYKQLLLIASGIQMAGPNLTPLTFEAALQRTRFPNPAHATRPGAVGFAGDWSMIDDAAEVWWSVTARGPWEDDRPGAYCYVDGGARHSLGRFPRDAGKFFQPPCDTGATS